MRQPVRLPSRFVPLAAALVLPLAAQAQTVSDTGLRGPGTAPNTALDRVIVTGNPIERSDLFELVSPISVLSGAALSLRHENSLGETLSAIPGVSSSYFGPNASRPIIRGQDSDRIRLLENGIGILDASALSNDHATTTDPLFVRRIEVVRGPAALLYGGSAIGGVVNVIDNRIPDTRIDGVGGAVELRYGGAERLKSGAAYSDFGTGHVAFHVDAFDRRSSDLEIPDYARSYRQRAVDDPAIDQPRDRLPNSGAHAYGGAVGASYVDDKGYLGLSVASLRNVYGTVAELQSTIRMKQERGDLAGELRDVGFFRKVKVKAGYTDYEHTEFDDGTPATTFKNRGYESRIDAIHEKLGPFEGAVGVQFGKSTFSALGVEAFVPETRTRNGALFVFEELPLGDFTLNGGLRVEKTRLNAAGGDPIDPPTGLPRFGGGGARDFTAASGSLGAIYKLTPGLSLVATGTGTQRAPTYFELFANGVHAATAGYEIGDPGFTKERSRSFEAAVRFKQGRFSGSFTAYRTTFSNYIGVFATGNTRDSTGNVDPTPDPSAPTRTTGGDEILAEYRYRQVPARFTGFELEGKVNLLEGAHKLDVEFGLDRVRATDQRTGEPLPRIAPMRARTALAFATGPIGAQLELIHARKQDQVPSGDLPTDAYTLTNVYLTYGFKLAGADLTAFVRGQNLFDQEARVASSFLRDLAPLPGRGVQAGLRATF